MHVVYLVAIWFISFPFGRHGSVSFSALRLCVFFLCGQIYTLLISSNEELLLSEVSE